MPLVIPVAHDFSCEWCYLAIFQVPLLKAEFGVAFDWIGYELQPEGLPWPEAKATPPPPPDKPKTPSRYKLACAAQGVEFPKIERPKRLMTFNAHVAAEFVKDQTDPFPFIERVYRAYWEQGRNVNEPDVLVELGQGIVETDELKAAIAERRNYDRVVKFDDEAYANGVYNVPTYWIGGERYAEQPLIVLRKALMAQTKV